MNFLFVLFFTISCLAAKGKKTPLSTSQFVLGEWTFDTYVDLSQEPIQTVVYNITVIDNVTSISPIVDGVQEEPIGRIETEEQSLTVFMNEDELFTTTLNEINKADIYGTQIVKDGVIYDVIVYNQRFPTFFVNVYDPKEGKKTIVANRKVIVPPKSFFQKYGMIIMIVVMGIMMLGRGVGPKPQTEAAAPAAADARPKTE